MVVLADFQVFYPLALAASLFSTQGVLPFKPNLPYFICVLVILAALIVATLIVCSNWTLWCQQIVSYLTVGFTCRKTTVEDDDRQDGEEIRHTTASPRAAKRSILRRVFRTPDSCTPRKLEEGTELEDLRQC